MSVDISQFTLAAYRKPLVAKPVDLCSSKGSQAKVVPVAIDWFQYPSFAVEINLNQGTPGATMDKLVGCYVDNSFNGQPLSLICPDTGYRIDVPANDQQFIPLFTRTNIVDVYNGSQLNSIGGPGILPQQIILLFTNFVYKPFDSTAFPKTISEAQISSILQGGVLASLFTPFILGDKHFDTIFDLGVTGSTPFFTGIAAPPINTGLLIITNMVAAIYNCYSAGAPITLAMNFNPNIFGFGTIYAYNAIINASHDYIPFTILQSLADRYLKFEFVNGVFSPVPTFNNTNAIPGGKAVFSFDCAWV